MEFHRVVIPGLAPKPKSGREPAAPGTRRLRSRGTESANAANNVINKQGPFTSGAPAMPPGEVFPRSV
jgi:hypothetical protein